MKEVLQEKLDNLFIKAGQYNKYQFVIVTLFTLQFLGSQFFHVNFSYLTSYPIIHFNNTEVKIDADWCKNYYNKSESIEQIHLSENQIPKSSIMIDFELSCHITEKYLLDIIYYFGNIIGSCVAYHFYEKIGTKVSLVIFAIIQMVCLFLLELLNVDTLKNSLIFLYVDLFFIGFSQYIVINLLFIYICDIVSLKQMPLFITTIVCGRILAGLLGVFFFEYLDLNWKHDIAIMNSVNVICLIIIIFYMVSSPKAALRNNEHMHFVKHLLKIARKNERKIKKEDFDFLVPFMDAKKKLEYDLFFNTINHRSKINSNQKDKDKINLEDNDEDDEYKDLILMPSDKDRKQKIKDDYLMSDENNKIGSIKTLFNEMKMRDFSILDFFKFKNHLINFCILSFLWAVYNFVKHGIASTMSEIPQYYNNPHWIIITHILGLANLFLIMILYIVNQTSFHKILLSIQLLTFVSLLVGAYLDDKEINIVSYIISLLIAKIIWNCLYLLLIIISLLIYPIMLRSKGLGWNIALGIFGKFVVTFVIDFSQKNIYILYFLLVDFFALVFSNGLPKKIGSFIIDLAEEDKRKKFLDKIYKEGGNDDKDINKKENPEQTISLMSIVN